MPEPYTIIEVRPEWVLEPEDMGSKSKFWYRKLGEHGANWLFKYPQANTGQHWAEKIAAEVADHLRIFHARVELAEFQGERGSVTESFARNNRELVHGNQILASTVSDYDPNMRFHQSNHTLENIWRSLERIFALQAATEKAKRQFAEYLVLDAVIGNTDRHHENWGLLQKRVGDSWQKHLAPTFDHASSLGRELLCEHRDTLLAENRVGDYAEKGHGAIYWSTDERRGPSSLELVRRAARAEPVFFRPAVLKLEKLDKSILRQIVYCVPADWMTSSAQEFAIALMRYNLEQLQRIIQ